MQPPKARRSDKIRWDDNTLEYMIVRCIDRWVSREITYTAHVCRIAVSVATQVLSQSQQTLAVSQAAVSFLRFYLGESWFSEKESKLQTAAVGFFVSGSGFRRGPAGVTSVAES